MLTVWRARAAPWFATLGSVLGLLLVYLWVDLSPRVEGDFFFADDDPQMEASRAVGERFPGGAQLILRVADTRGDRATYFEQVGGLTTAMLAVEGVVGGYSVTTEDADRSPLFSRLLLNPDSAATNIILQVDDTDPELLLPRVEEVIDRFDGGDLEIIVSGVPAIVEMIRRALYRDLVVFSLAAVLVFALLIGVVFRDAAVVVGVLATCLATVSSTLLIVQLLGVGIGLLTANLVTIVFVLTLSHVVFMTANWRRRSVGAVGAGERSAALEVAVSDTWSGSFWSMTTTLLGFASLLVASARPLRELGIAGVIGAITALVGAYALYPMFLGQWARPGSFPGADEGSAGRRLGSARSTLVVAAAAVLLIGVGAGRVNTDPGLLSYFAPDTPLHDGLARVDEDGGSSTLDLVVADPDGALVHDGEVYPRLEALQARLEADPAVGVVLSPTVLIDHARTVPLAGLLPVSLLLDLTASDQLNNVALSYVTAERDQARFSLRMRETAGEPRVRVLERLRAAVQAEGLRADYVSGLYDLQAQLGTLIASSLRIGIGGLLALFLLVSWAVARRASWAGMMWLCLAAIPAVILGTFGHLGIALDIITSPAANIALAIGADSMIHMVVRVRQQLAAGSAFPWEDAVAQIGRPIAGATAIIIAGFGIFALSSFPPTRRFGVAVIVGTITAALMALVVLPRMACLGERREGT